MDLEFYRMNINDMVHLCRYYSPIAKNRVQVIGHEVIPGTYDWSPLQFSVAGAEQKTEFPKPVGDIIGTVYEYVGETNEQFVNGVFYECANLIPRFEYIDFYNLYDAVPRPRHRIRKLMGNWTFLY